MGEKGSEGLGDIEVHRGPSTSLRSAQDDRTLVVGQGVEMVRLIQRMLSQREDFDGAVEELGVAAAGGFEGEFLDAVGGLVVVLRRMSRTCSWCEIW